MKRLSCLLGAFCVGARLLLGVGGKQNLHVSPFHFLFLVICNWRRRKKQDAEVRKTEGTSQVSYLPLGRITFLPYLYQVLYAKITRE